MCDNCDRNNDSGFLFGMIIGGIIGAFIAIYFYKNNKTKVFANLKEKIESYFIPQTPAKKNNKTKVKVVAEKIPVILPHQVIKASTPPKSVTTKSKKMFKK